MNLAKLVGKSLVRVGNRMMTTFPVPPDAHQEARTRWFDTHGDTTLRVDYDLNSESTVFDFGGYKGDWSCEIAAMYACSIHVFEGVDTYAAKIARRFARNSKIIVHNFGLSGSNSTLSIRVSEERSSLFGEGGELKTLKLVAANEFLAAEHIEKVDLAKINIEGGEYDLLDHLLESGDIKKFVNIQVQFHDFVPNAAVRMKAIQDRLRLTHELTYQYPFIWENWRAK